MLYLRYSNTALYNTILLCAAPDYSLYNDNDIIQFVFNPTSKELKIILPAKCGDIAIDDGTIYMSKLESIMIIAPESGIVQSCGAINSYAKYVDIACANGVLCKISNLDLLGVSVGDIVKKGKEIGTTTKNATVIMNLYEGQQKIKSISVVKNIVQWTN